MCECVCMRASVRVCFCFRAALSPVSRVASSFSFAHTYTHTAHTDLSGFCCYCCCFCHLGTLLWSLNEFFSLPRLVVFNCFMRSLAARRSAHVVPCVVASAFKRVCCCCLCSSRLGPLLSYFSVFHSLVSIP